MYFRKSEAQRSRLLWRARPDHRLLHPEAAGGIRLELSGHRDRGRVVGDGELLEEDRPGVREARGDRRQQQLFRVRLAARPAEAGRSRDRNGEAALGDANLARPRAVPFPARARMESMRRVVLGHTGIMT